MEYLKKESDMKELSIEEKAMAYDKAFKEAESIHRFSSDIAEIKRMEQIFPELKESKNEWMRKALIKYFSKGREYLSLIPYNKEQVLAWLEKQGEQKPYGQEDENVLEDIKEAIINYWHGDTQDILLDWLKSLKERITTK